LLIIVYNGRVVWPSLPQHLGPIRSLVGFSGHVIASRVLWYWYGQSDQVILARLLHASLLGYYNVAAQLAMLPANKAMEVINRVSLPVLSRLRAEDGSVRDMHHRLVGLVATYAFGTCWGLAAVAPELVSVVLGNKWQPATQCLMLLAAVAPLRMLSALNNTVTTAAGVPQASTVELAFAGLVMPLAVLIGAMLGGLQGAGVAWPAAYPAVYLLSNALTCKAVKARQHHGLQPLLGPVIAAATMWLCIWAVRAHFAADISAGWLLGLEIGTGAISYIVVLHAVALGLAQDARSLLRDLMRPPAGVKVHINETIQQ
jgi:teichuronic acid exporter